MLLILKVLVNNYSQQINLSFDNNAGLKCPRYLA